MEILELLGMSIPEGLSVTPMSPEEKKARLEKAINSRSGDLKYVDCPICHNKGYIAEVREDGTLNTWDCECMPKRKSLQQIERSGISELMQIYTFDTYETSSRATDAIKQAAEKYTAERKGWFFICGKPGSGKTHICTAMCGQLLQSGLNLRYMLWRDMAPKLKALVNERDIYERTMGELKAVDVLYIDDFFKGSITDADINLAFELLNARYCAPKKLTIISTEKSIEQIVRIDEAIGSRIYERSRAFCLKAPEVNRRFE